MKMLAAAAVFLGSTVGAMATESYTDYRDYFDATPAAAVRVPRGDARTMYGVDTRRHDTRRHDGRDATNSAALRPGHWNQAGGYVPPDYATPPRGASQEGFWSPNAVSAGNWGAPRAFTGSLGTRR